MSPVAKALGAITEAPLPEVIIAVLAGAGLLAALGGLLGHYPTLTDRVPRHALAGVATTVVAGAVTGGVFAWVIGARVLSAVSAAATPPTPPTLAFVSLLGVMALAFAVTGTACLRAGMRAVAGLLLALAVPWVVLLGAGAVYGSTLPAWVALPTYGAIPVGFLLTGYVVRRHASAVDRPTPAGDVTTN